MNRARYTEPERLHTASVTANGIRGAPFILCTEIGENVCFILYNILRYHFPEYERKTVNPRGNRGKPCR